MTAASKNKNRFSSRLGFIAVASSAAIGLGNIWRFPYLVGRYGGASFVLLYLACIFLLGYPIMVAKLALGRAKRGGNHKAYQALGGGKWLLPGILSTLSALLVLAFYPVVMGWLIGYLLYYTKGVLIMHPNPELFFEQFVQNFPEQLGYTATAWLLMLIVVGAGIKKGTERFATVVMPFFYLLLALLFCYAFSLEGSQKGFIFYLVPQRSAFTSAALLSAIGQAFASLAIGNGVSIACGSYVNKTENLLTAGFEIITKDTLVAFFSGLIIFPLIFHATIEPSGGPSLIFCSLPLAFQVMGKFIGSGLGALFFFLLFIAAITSAITLLEVPVKYFMERFNMKRKYALLISALFSGFLGLCNLMGLKKGTFFSHLFTLHGEKKDFFYLIDLIGVEILMPLAGTFFCLAVIYGWRIENLMASLKSKNPYFKLYFRFTLNYLAPFTIIALWITKFFHLLR